MKIPPFYADLQCIDELDISAGPRNLKRRTPRSITREASLHLLTTGKHRATRKIAPLPVGAA